MRHPVTGEEVPDGTDQVPIYRYVNARSAVWQEADYIVSNPPFVGDKRMRNFLGDGYVQKLREIHSDVPEMCDFVMYWWNQAAKLTIAGKYSRVGLITTNSIKQTFNRRILHNHLNTSNGVDIFFAIPDHPWVDNENSASVRIAMTGFGVADLKATPDLAKWGSILSENEAETPEEQAENIKLEWKNVGKIYEDLRYGADVSSSAALLSNSEIISVGVALHAQGFVISESLAEEWLSSDSSDLSKVIRLTLNGRDLTDKPRKQYVIDFFGMSLEEASRFSIPYQWILERVLPLRKTNNRKSYREIWWIFGEPRPQLRKTLVDIKKYIATPLTAKHRFFTVLSKEVLPDQSLVTIALEDCYFLGVLSSKIHVAWALAAGGRLGVGNDPRYNKTRCFDPFPFPSPTEPQKQKIRELGDRLDSHRKQVQTTHPDITITGMYNLLEKLRAGTPFTDSDRDYNNRALVSTLKQIHDELDTAVFEAYDWSPTLTDEAILERLVALNADRAAEERNGLIRWLRPEYQAPDRIEVQQAIEGMGETEAEAIVIPTEQQPFPKNLKAQLAAIRDLLRTQGGEWTAAQVTAHFKGANRKAQTIHDCLESLEDLGILLSHTENSVKCWYLVELQKVS
jgi:hypothetical protein